MTNNCKILQGLLCSALFLTTTSIQQTFASEQVMEQAYYQILDDIVQEYGLFHDEYEESMDLHYLMYQSGLAYATLIDFDNNGTDELLLYYTEINDLEIMGFTLELWGYEQGEAVQYQQFDFLYDRGMTPFGYEIYQSSEGWYYIRSSESNGGIQHENFMTLRNGVMVEERFENAAYPDWNIIMGVSSENYEVNDNEFGWIYAKDGVHLSTAEFNQMMSVYTEGAKKGLEISSDSQLVWEIDHSLYNDLKTQDNQTQDLEKILEALPYTGDISKLHLTAEQALAMAEKIENCDGNTLVALFDRGDNQANLLIGQDFAEEDHWMGYHTYTLHYLTGNSLNTLAPQDYYKSSFKGGYVEVKGNETILYLDGWTGGQESSDTRFDQVYRLSQGIPAELISYSLNYGFIFGLTFLNIPGYHHEWDYDGYENSSNEEKLEKIFSDLDYMDLGEISLNINHLLESDSYYIVIENGVSVPSSQASSVIPNTLYEGGDNILHAPFYGSPLEWHVGNNNSWASGDDVAALLRAYAEKADLGISFSDLSSSSWYYNAVQYVCEHGLMSGTGNGNFSPNMDTSRAMIVQVLYNMAGKPQMNGENFSDVTSNDWFADAVSWASAVGVASGTGHGNFNPNADMNREQLMVMLYGYQKILAGESYTGSTNLSFTDSASISSWAVEATVWAVSQGIVTGKTGGGFAPKDTATRAEVAQILMNFVEMYS